MGPESEHATIVVEPRVVRRVIKRHRRASVGLHVPHTRCYALSREDLLAIVDPRELGEAGASLPPRVILVARSALEEGPETALWRVVFHAHVHLELERKQREGALSTASVRARIDRIGQTEFDEIRLVLRQDDHLLPRCDEVETYAEFAACFLELLHFSPRALERTFPTLVDPRAVVATLALDLDVAAVLEGCRPPGAPSSPGQGERVSHLHEVPVRPSLEALRKPSPAEFARLTSEADQAHASGNAARASLLRLSAFRYAPVQDAPKAFDSASDELRLLAERLEGAIRPVEEAPPAEEAARVDAWVAALMPLGQSAVATPGALWRTTEARLLYDLQKACSDAEREIRTVDVIEWVTSLGGRPVVRALAAAREVRVVRHLRAALRKLAHVEIAPRDHDRLAHCLEEALARGEACIRRVLRPKIEAVLDEVGLRAVNLPERVARRKLVEELLDAVSEHGFLSIGQLRDAFSRNELKLGDVGPAKLVLGDELLRADRRLAIELDGVYRRGEIYLRILQKLSSIAFGTALGRVFTLFLALPVLASFVVLQGLDHTVVHLVAKATHQHHLHLYSRGSFVGVALLTFALLHSALARRVVGGALHLVGVVLSTVLVRAPRWVLTRPMVRRILGSRAMALFGRWILKPALLSCVAFLLVPFAHLARRDAAMAAGALFVVTNLFLNSRAGMIVEEAAIDWMAARWRFLTRHFFPGLFHLIAETFKTLLAWTERFIYAVDEWLRFRRGESVVSLVSKAALGVVWFFVTFLIRFYVNLLIEPQVNPIKHFPVVTVSHKIVLPMAPTIFHGISTVLRPLGRAASHAIAGPTVVLLPGVFGFLAWELKENWKLYRASRPKELRPVMVGHHGETIGGLLLPGFHSGTVPKLHAKIRRRGESEHGKLHAAVHEVEHAVTRFVERELVAVIEESPRWRHGALAVAAVGIGSNRVGIDLALFGNDARTTLHFEEQSGWIVASVARRGFVDALDDEGRAVLTLALAGFYKRAGVDLVREQIEELIGDAPYDIADEGLLVWPGEGYQTEVVYDLSSKAAKLAPEVSGSIEKLEETPATLDARKLRFRDQSVEFARWVEAWNAEAPAGIVDGPSLLRSRPRVG